MAGAPRGTGRALVVTPAPQSAAGLAVLRIPRRYVPVLAPMTAPADKGPNKRDHKPLKQGSARRPMDLQSASRRLFVHYSI
jgi:hypothetical protein